MYVPTGRSRNSLSRLHIVGVCKRVRSIRIHLAVSLPLYLPLSLSLSLSLSPSLASFYKGTCMYDVRMCARAFRGSTYAMHALLKRVMKGHLMIRFISCMYTRAFLS